MKFLISKFNYKYWLRRSFSILLISAFLTAQICPIANAQSVLNLPAPGTMISTTPSFIPPMVRGITIYPNNPFLFDFIIDAGDNKLEGEAFKRESDKLIKYFLASLTTPEKEMWVNLSPYEKDRIIADGLGRTDMGRDLLAQDYILKQLTASLMFPEDELGKEFWKRVYAKAHEKYGTSEIPMNTFNKIWIVPDKANVYVNGTSIFVAKSYLKVMLEEDYLALESNAGSTEHGLGEMTKDDIEIISGVSSEIVREILIPEIEKEVNNGEHFSNLRQIYNSMILATWYKQNLKNSLLGQIYVDRSKAKGIDLEDKEVNQKIYDQYVKAFEKGVFDFIREDYDETTQEIIPRKYFSGGLDLPVSERLGEAATGLTVRKTLEDRPINTVSFYLDTVKSIDNFRRIINVLARSESVPELSENAKEDEIMEYMLGYMVANDLINEQAEVDGDVRVYAIKDEVKNTRLGKAIQKYVMERKRGAQAINFPGIDGNWNIVGFEGEITNQLEVEREEVRRRKRGEHWIEAYVEARGEKMPEGLLEEAQQIKAGRKDAILSASTRQDFPAEKARLLSEYHETVHRKVVRALSVDHETWAEVDVKPSRQVEEEFDPNASEMLFILKPGVQDLDVTLPEVLNRIAQRGYAVSKVGVLQGNGNSMEDRELKGRVADHYLLNSAFANHGSELVASEERDNVNRIFDTKEFRRNYNISPSEVPIVGLKEFEEIVRQAGDPRSASKIISEFYSELTPDLFFPSDLSKTWKGLVSIGLSKNVLAREYNGKVYFFANSHYSVMEQMFLKDGHQSIFLVLKKTKESPFTWDNMRRNFLGDGRGGSPELSLRGSLRRDAHDGLLGAMARVDAIYNLGHLSASSLEAMKEIELWFGNRDNVFRKALKEAGYPDEQIEFFGTNPLLYQGNNSVRLFKFLKLMDVQEAIDTLVKISPPFFEDGVQSPSISFGEFLSLQQLYQTRGIGLHTNPLSDPIEPANSDIYHNSNKGEQKRILLVGSSADEVSKVGEELSRKLEGDFEFLSVQDILLEASRTDSDLEAQMMRGEVRLEKLNNVLLRKLSSLTSRNVVLTADSDIVHFPFKLAGFNPTHAVILENNEIEARNSSEVLQLRNIQTTVLVTSDGEPVSVLAERIQQEVSYDGEIAGNSSLKRMDNDTLDNFSRMVQEGKIARVRPIAGTGSRFFAEGAKIPEHKRIKGLAPIGHIEGKPVPALVLSLLHDQAVAREFGGGVHEYVVTKREQHPVIEETLNEWGFDNVRYLSVNDVPRLTPFPDEAKKGKKAVSTSHSDVPPGEILRFEDTAAPSQKNVGHFDTLASIILSGQLVQMINDGVEMVYVTNGEDLGGALSPELFELLAQHPEKEMVLSVVEQDKIFELYDDEVDSQKPFAKVLVRKYGDRWGVVEERIPGALKDKKLNVGVDQKGSLLLFNEEDGELVSNKNIRIEGKVEKGGSLVSVHGRDRIVEGLAFPEDYDTSQPMLLNSNQMIIKLDAIVRLLGFSFRDELLGLWRTDREEFVRKAREAFKQFKTYVEIKDVLVKENGETDTTTALAQFSRLIGDITSELDTMWVLKSRDAEVDGLGGYYNLKEPEDVEAFQDRINTMIDEIGIQRGNLVQEDGVGIDDMVNVNSNKVRLVDKTGSLQGEFDLDEISLEDYKRVMDMILRIKLSLSRFGNTHRKLLLGNAVFDFVGEGLIPEHNERWLSYQNERAQEILTFIYRHPETRRKFLEYFKNYTIVVTFENVNTPIFAAVLNALQGRSLTDRQAVEELDAITESETLNAHPVYGDSLPNVTLPDIFASIDSRRGTSEEPVSILAFAAGEKAGKRQKLDLLQSAVQQAMPGSNVEISAYDINYPQEVHEFDAQGSYQGVREVYSFDEDNWHSDSERGIDFRKLDIRNPRDNVTLESYAVPEEERYDVVYDSRMAVWYNKYPEKYNIIRNNLLKHVKPGGILLHDAPSADHLEIWKVNLDGSYQLEGLIPYEDTDIAQKNINRITRRFESISDKEKDHVEKAYYLASTHIGTGHDLMPKRVLASFLAHASQDIPLTLAFILQDVPVVTIKSAFPEDVHDKVIPLITNVKGGALNFEYFAQHFYESLQPFYRRAELKKEEFDGRSIIDGQTPIFVFGQFKLWVAEVDQNQVVAVQTSPGDVSYYVSDQAQLSGSDVGGINLNPNMLNLESSGSMIELNLIENVPSLQNLQIDGFVPVIIQIVPTTNLPMLIGDSKEEEQQQLSLAQ